METKRIFIVGVEGSGSGCWDWFPKQEDAETMYQGHLVTFADLEGEIIYKGELDVPVSLSQNETTTFVEEFLMEHGFESSPLLNKFVL